jgi:hypothetical protein
MGVESGKRGNPQEKPTSLSRLARLRFKSLIVPLDPEIRRELDETPSMTRRAYTTIKDILKS